MDQNPKLIIMRHPQSLANIGHRVAGNDDVLSSDYWKKQALVIADHYAGEFDDFVLYSSTKIRCKDIVEALHKKNNLMATISDVRLNERDFGSFHNISKEKMMEMFRMLMPDHHDPHNFTAWMDIELSDENGEMLYESNFHFQNRLIPLVRDRETKYLQQDIPVFAQTHSGAIRQLLSILLNELPQSVDALLPNNKIPNSSITEFEYDKTTWLYLLNQDKIAYIDPIVQKKIDSISPRKTW